MSRCIASGRHGPDSVWKIAFVSIITRFPSSSSTGRVPVSGPTRRSPHSARLEPDAGWQLWNAPDWHYPNTVLLAFEAIHAAKLQSSSVSEQLDRALRRAFWAESRCIGHHNVILEIAGTFAGLDAARLAHDLTAGTCSACAVFDDLDHVTAGAVVTSPHVFLPDGTDHANPGIAVHWQGEWARGFPVIDRDDPSVYETIFATAGN